MLFKENSERSIMFLRASLVVVFLLFAAIVRILPHPWNFTPIGAMALFSGAKLGKKWQAFLFPLAGLFLGDLFVGFHRLIPIVYFSFCISVLIGMAFRRKQTPGPLSLATLLGAIQFFLITNFGMWAMGTMSIYPRPWPAFWPAMWPGYPISATPCWEIRFTLLYSLGDSPLSSPSVQRYESARTSFRVNRSHRMSRGLCYTFSFGHD